MNFDLSDEQTMLRDSVQRFGARYYPANERLGLLQRGRDPARWGEMAALGWLALGVPETHGGLGGGAVETMVVMEGVGRHLMPEPYAINAVFAAALLSSVETGPADVLANLIAGEAMIAPALAEIDSGFDLDRVATRAEGLRLNGAKSHCEDGGDADWFIVSARANDGIGLFLVAADAPGLTVERFRAIDHHRHASLRFDDVQATAMIAAPDRGLPLLEAAVDATIAALLAEALGSMDALRDITLDYLRTRRQFGVPIGSFQALQHRMVDIDIACEEARSMVYHATLHLDREPEKRRRAIAAAKARVGQCGLFVGRQAVQLHGGLGMSAELIVSHHLKRLMMIDLAFGNAEHHKSVFAAAA